MKQKILICLLAFIAFLSFSTVQAQGWDKTFTFSGDTTIAYNVVETHDSGFVFGAGSYNSINGIDFGARPIIVKVDKLGNIVWRYKDERSLIDTDNSSLKVLRTSDNGFIVITTDVLKIASEQPSLLVIKLNQNGIEQSRKYYLNKNYFMDADITPELDRIVISSEQDSFGFRRDNFSKMGSNLFQINVNGDSITRRLYRNTFFRRVIFGGDRQIYARKYVSSPQSFGFNKYNLAGDSLWFFSESTNRFNYWIKRAKDGRILSESFIKFDYDGRIIFPNPYKETVYSFNSTFAESQKNNNICSYVFSGSGRYFFKKDSTGQNLISSQRLDNLNTPIGEPSFDHTDFISTSDGGFLLAGTTDVVVPYRGARKVRLIKFDADGLIYPNLLKGKIYIDSVQNCRLDIAEKGFPNRLVSVTKPTATLWTVADSLGNYVINIDTGRYTVQALAPNTNWRFCTPSVSKQISAANPIDTVNFALQALVNCPQMRISMSTQGLRRCFDNNVYHIRYTNEGTQAAQNAFITLKLDSLLEYVGASRPLSNRTGQTLRFNIGTVPIGFDDQFSVQVRVKCGDSTRLGQTLCTEARIFPDTVCIPAPNWSGANIVVSGRCDRDSVRFLIQNIGTGASSNLRRQIVEDEIVFLNGIINVPASENRTISVPANGKTWRLNVEQEPNNPLSNQPTAVVEGCRTSPNQAISTGFINQFPTDDGSPTIDNVCSPIVGAYDPNDKEGLPLGYKNERFINQNQAIDYRIRFQNTGNDTAFTVVLRDTLSDFLDISSLKVGASSHKYTWTIEGRNVLVFRFDNILLVDSFRNAAASQGFVSFKINQKKDVALGSKINNQADIYFDFNAPIFTNKTVHTVGKDFIVSVLQLNSASPNVKINVFPNPFSAEATIEIEGFDKIGPLSISSNFTLFDAFGRQLRSEKFDGSQYLFERQNLGTGIYFFKIENGGQLIGMGKFLIQ